MTKSLNNTNRRRVAILGAGYISKFHVEAVRAIRGVELCAICDLSKTKGEALARAYGVPMVYSTLDKMLAEAKIDVVHVLLPPQIHASAILRILEAGVDVLAEKPLGVSFEECELISNRAKELGRTLGVSHNFLFSPNYERFHDDLLNGRFGRVDQIDIVWNKELGQIKGGPFGGWLFARPENVLLEVGTHSFVHLAHLIGSLDDLSVHATDRIELPPEGDFYRCWDILGWKGNITSRLRFTFTDSFTQHYIQVHGTSAVAKVDFEQGTYLITEHTAQVLDLDRYAAAVSGATSSLVQATDTLVRFVLSKIGLIKGGAPYQRSITRCVRAFYEGLLAKSLDERIRPELAILGARLADRIRNGASLNTPDHHVKIPSPQQPTQSDRTPTVLVLGGTGFIGQALVRQLCGAGHHVRLLARNPSSVSAQIRALGIEVVRGDLTDTASVAAALPGIKHVYHLARGYGETWEDYLHTDIEPTQRLAELCLDRGVERLYYTSSISIYYAGRRGDIITEETPPHEGVLRANLYSGAKVEIERILLKLHKERGLGAVIFRPGIVLGPGGNPLHWGIAGWPFSSVARLWGDGKSQLPIVLVNDCADALVRAISVPNIEGESFNLVGKPCLTALQYLDELEHAAGRRFRRVPTSSFRYFIEDVGKYVIKTMGRDPNRKLPSYANWDGRTFEARFDSSHAEKQLGWQPINDRAHVVREGIVAPAAQFLS